MEPLVVASEQTGWKSVDRIPPLKEGEVHVWRMELKNTLDLASLSASYLSSQERERADRRIAGGTREEFVAGRACLRILLGQVFGIEPLLVPLTENAFGKPESEFTGQRIFFNVTHTRGNVLIATARDGPIGVDVEHINPVMDVTEIAAFAFTRDEFERLLSIVPEDERKVAFYRGWTRKEAVAKADGRGLSLDLCKIWIPITAKQLAPIRAQIRDEGVPKDYLLCDMPLAENVVGAVAMKSQASLIDWNWFDFPPSFLAGYSAG